MNQWIYLVCSWQLASTRNLNFDFDFKFQVFLSHQERKKKSFICFLGEVMAQQFCFENYWPLVCNGFFTSFSFLKWNCNESHLLQGFFKNSDWIYQMALGPLSEVSRILQEFGSHLLFWQKFNRKSYTYVSIFPVGILSEKQMAVEFLQISSLNFDQNFAQ